MLQQLETSLTKFGYGFFLPFHDYVTFVDADGRSLMIQFRGGIYWLYWGNKPKPTLELHESDNFRDILDFILV